MAKYETVGFFSSYANYLLSLVYQGNKASGLLVWGFEFFFGFRFVKLLQRYVQIELAALYWILIHGWILRMIAEGEGDLSFHL